MRNIFWKDHKEPTSDEVRTAMEVCQNEGDVSLELRRWFGKDHGFKSSEAVAVAIISKAPWINKKLADTLLDIDSSLVLWMEDAERFPREVMREASEELCELMIYLDKKSLKKGEKESDRNASLLATVTSLLKNPETTDAQLAGLARISHKYETIKGREWRKVALHGGAGEKTWNQMATLGDDLDIIKALAACPTAISACHAAAASVHYHADEHPELLLAYVRAQRRLSQASRGTLYAKWGWLVKNHPEEVLSIRDKVSDSFLVYLGKEAMGAMMASPHKEMRQWAAKIIGLMGAMGVRLGEVGEVLKEKATETEAPRPEIGRKSGERQGL